MKKLEDRLVRMKKDGREGFVLMVLKSNTGKKMKRQGLKGTWTYVISFSKNDKPESSIYAKRGDFDYIEGTWEFEATPTE